MNLLNAVIERQKRYNELARSNRADGTIERHFLERAATKQDERAARMSAKIGRGNRRAAKAAMRAAALHEQATTTRDRRTPAA